PSGNLHIPHPYSTLPPHVIPHYKTIQPYHLPYLTPTHHHRQKIQQKPQKPRKTQLQYLDEIISPIKNLSTKLHISNHHFIPTTQHPHNQLLDKLFHRLLKQPHIYLPQYQASYSL
uniref:class I tRNA ligase family protein n=1 Tax=Staphylococcus epidermidis TaxID=1282 RepID=UPI0011A6D7DE